MPTTVLDHTVKYGDRRLGTRRRPITQTSSPRNRPFTVVATHGRRLLGGDWATVLRLDDGDVRASDGDAPDGRWLVAFVEGSRTSARVAEGRCGPEDVVWSPLPGASLALVVGRQGAPFRARERRQASALARIADARLQDLSRRVHPSSRR